MRDGSKQSDLVAEVDDIAADVLRLTAGISPRPAMPPRASAHSPDCAIYQDLMARAEHRLRQEVSRLGGHYAHVLEEAIDSRHDDRTGEAWLRGRLTYVLFRRGG